jgi:hydrogenase expression/formation protein HypC
LPKFNKAKKIKKGDEIMCLSIPSKVVKIDKEKNTAIVDTMGVTREAGLDLMAEGDVKVGDYVLLHIGFVMNKIDEENALESIKVYEEILEKMDEEDRQRAILEDNECQIKD